MVPPLNLAGIHSNWGNPNLSSYAPVVNLQMRPDPYQMNV